MIDFNEEALDDLIYTLQKARNCKRAYYNLRSLEQNQIFKKGFEGKSPFEEKEWLQYVHGIIIECINLIEGKGNE